MRRAIDSLRERPHHERRAVAAWAAIGIVIILLAAWLLSFFGKIQGGEGSPSPARDQQIIESQKSTR